MAAIARTGLDWARTSIQLWEEPVEFIHHVLLPRLCTGRKLGLGTGARYGTQVLWHGHKCFNLNLNCQSEWSSDPDPLTSKSSTESHPNHLTYLS